MVSGRRVLISVRQLGLRDTLVRAIGGYFRPHRFIGLRNPLRTRPGPVITEAAPQLWHRDTLASWRRGRRSLPVEFFRDEIDRVEWCVVLPTKETVVGLIWIYCARDWSRFFRLEPDEAELNYGHVLPAFRRRGLFRSLLTFACNRLREVGCRSVYTAVHERNPPSLRAFRAAGFTDMATIRHFLMFRPRMRTAAAAAREGAATAGGSV